MSSTPSLPLVVVKCRLCEHFLTQLPAARNVLGSQVTLPAWSLLTAEEQEALKLWSQCHSWPTLVTHL